MKILDNNFLFKNQQKFNETSEYNKLNNRKVKIGLISTVALASLYIANTLAGNYARTTLIPISRSEPFQFFDSLEANVHHEFGDSIIQFNNEDLRSKLLYITTEYNYKYDNEGFKLHRPYEYEGKTFEIGTYPLLNQLNNFNDVKFKVIDKANQICDEISEAAKNGHKIKSLIIAVHGIPYEIMFRDNSLKALNWGIPVPIKELDKNCFDGLDENAEIILDSCDTGQRADGVASALAKLSKKIVYAPRVKTINFLTSYSSDNPPKPTFKNHFSSEKLSDIGIKDLFMSFNDATCKFYPDGTSTCHMFWDQTIPNIKKYIKSFFA